VHTLADSAKGSAVRPLSAIERRNRCAGIALLLGLILYAFWFDPDAETPLRCYFKEVTGHNCFACGMSHALHASACLDWAAAFGHHLFGPVLFVSAWALSACWTAEIVRGRRMIARLESTYLKAGVALAAAVWLAWWLARLRGTP